MLRTSNLILFLSKIPHYPDKSGQAVRNDILD
jgi:hypothetical protein